MTREETVKVLMTISAAYQNFRVDNKEVAVNLWMMMLGDYDYRLVMAALKTYIATDDSGYPPNVGKINNIIGSLAQAEDGEITEAEAWSMVSRALRNSTYNSKSEFDKLPEAIQKAVGSANMLYQWATDEHFNESVISSNFMRSYREIVKRKKEFALIPASVKQTLNIGQKGAVMIGECL